ncbi:hypothetical protein [Sediminibacterium sp.]|uniref:hypothetical protein n=1 Tax=Sediminibacterium sp. TaxID=1917865 RepID=UPI003F715D9F
MYTQIGEPSTELTFMDFGYKTALDEKKYADISDYSYNGKREMPWINPPTKSSLLKTRKPNADAVAAWWQKSKADWTRIGALKEALQLVLPLKKSNNKRIAQDAERLEVLWSYIDK